MKKLPQSKTENVVIQKLDNETLLYDLDLNKAFCLNETSELVWQLSDGTRTITQISDEMSKRLKTLVSEDLVWLAIDQLEKDGLIENQDNLNNKFEGLSRREVIRKVGFTSMVALPIVSSLVAPQASTAQSCIANNNSCAAPGSTCCSGNCLTIPFGGGAQNCCAAGVTGGLAPGSNSNCVTPGDTAACNSSAAAGCCSGTGTIGTANPAVCPTAGSVPCICD